MLERYAALNAEIEAGEELASVLARESIAKETWLSAQAFWLSRMADEAKRERFETTTRYQSLFTAKRKVFEAKLERAKKKREREKPKAPPVEVLAGAARELAAPPHMAVPGLSFPEPPVRLGPPRAEIAAPEEAPTTARDAQPPAHIAKAPLPVTAPPPMVAVPAFVNAPAVVAAPTDPLPPAKAKKFGTMTIDLPSAPSAATPFQGKVAPAPPSDPSPQTQPPNTLPAVAKKRDLGSTWGPTDEPTGSAMPFRAEVASRAGSSPPAPVSEGLPFHRDSSSAVPVVRAAAAVPAAQPGPAPEIGTGTAPIPADLQQHLRAALGGKRNMNATMMADTSFMPADATPFQRGAPAKSPPAPPPPSAEPARVDDDDDDMPRTKMVDPDAVKRALAQATPFAQSHPTAPIPPAAASSPGRDGFGSSPSHPATTAPPPTAVLPNAEPPRSKKFSINVFASLTAEIAENPSDVEAIRQRYGISEAEHREESGRWTAEFNQSDELRQRYLGIVQRYRGYIQQRKRG